MGDQYYMHTERRVCDTCWGVWNVHC